MNREQPIQITEDIVETPFRFRYRRLAKSASKYIKVFNEFSRNTKYDVRYSDFLKTLEVHLLMEGYSMKDIRKYVDSVVSPRLGKLIRDQVEFAKGFQQ